MISNNHPSPLPSPHHWPVPTMVDSQTSPTGENSLPPLPSVASPTASLPSQPIQQQRSPSKSTGSQSINFTENQEIKQKAFLNNQTAQIVVAKYSYEPLQFSPNDHPEVELPLNVGEYYLVYGDVDEVNKSLVVFTN